MIDPTLEIVSVQEVMETLSIGRNRVYELLENGDIKGFKIGHVWKIPRKSVEEYIEAARTARW